MSPPSVRVGKRPAQTQLDNDTYRALKIQAAQRDMTLPRLIEVILVWHVRNGSAAQALSVLDGSGTAEREAGDRPPAC